MSGWTRAGVALAVAGLVVGMLVVDWVHGAPEDEHVVPGASASRGRELLYEFGCGSCHLIPGVDGADGMVGPPLSGWAARRYIAGALYNTPDGLVRFIMEPGAVEPGTAMPDLGVSREEARHMAAYLYTVGDANPLGPPHPFPASWLKKWGEFHPTGPNE